VLRIRLLLDPDPGVRRAAARSISSGTVDVWSKVPPEILLPVLNQAIKDSVESVAAGAIKVLGVIDSPEAVSILAGALDDPRYAVRYLVLDTLGEIGPRAAAALPRLRRLEAESDGMTRITATETIEKIEKGGPGR